MGSAGRLALESPGIFWAFWALLAGAVERVGALKSAKINHAPPHTQRPTFVFGRANELRRGQTRANLWLDGDETPL